MAVRRGQCEVDGKDYTKGNVQKIIKLWAKETLRGEKLSFWSSVYTYLYKMKRLCIFGCKKSSVKKWKDCAYLGVKKGNDWVDLYICILIIRKDIISLLIYYLLEKVYYF